MKFKKANTKNHIIPFLIMIHLLSCLFDKSIINPICLQLLINLMPTLHPLSWSHRQIIFSLCFPLSRQSFFKHSLSVFSQNIKKTNCPYRLRYEIYSLHKNMSVAGFRKKLIRITIHCCKYGIMHCHVFLTEKLMM